MSADLRQVIEGVLLVFAALFPIVNPLGGAPIFVAMTSGLSPAERAALAWQVTLSTEVLFMLTLALLVSLAGTAVLVPDLRLRLRRSIAPLAFAYALTAILVAPFTYYLATSSERTPNPGAQTFNGDLLNFVVPTRASLGGWWSGDLAAHFPGNDIEWMGTVVTVTVVVAGGVPVTVKTFMPPVPGAPVQVLVSTSTSSVRQFSAM